MSNTFEVNLNQSNKLGQSVYHDPSLMQTQSLEISNQCFKDKYSICNNLLLFANYFILARRKKWADDATVRYPTKVALIVEKANQCNQ